MWKMGRYTPEALRPEFLRKNIGKFHDIFWNIRKSFFEKNYEEKEFCFVDERNFLVREAFFMHKIYGKISAPVALTL